MKFDGMTVLIHLGYLAYDADRREAYISNEEVRTSFANAVQAIRQSDRLLRATWNRDAEAAAKGINVFLPGKHSDKPAMVVELKYNQSAEGAIAQIKERKYSKALEDYQGNLLLVEINYDKEKKEHSCVIEETNVRY